jgi:hypothetical protein
VRKHHVGDGGGRLVGPAVLPGQLDRLPAALGRRSRNRRQVGLDRRLVCQAAELEERPTDPAGQRDALLQVPFRVLRPGRPELGNAEGDQR